MGGIMHVTGEPDDPPTSVVLPICDPGTGMWAVQNILAALYERQRTGKGCLVECSLRARHKINARFGRASFGEIV
jgi:succinate---hydroxymethylglutarate CoA-transferase